MPSSSFYVTLTSGAYKNEFPDNQAQRFKNRLFHSLIFREPGWRVGLASLTIPRVLPDIRGLYEEGKSFLNHTLFEWTYGEQEQSDDRVKDYNLVEGSSLKDVKQAFSSTGVEMMKFFTDSYIRKRHINLKKGGKVAARNGKKYCIDFQWKGEDLLINNENVFRDSTNGRPIIKISKKLALQMEWFVLDLFDVIELGPNLIMSLYENIVPEATDIDRTSFPFFWKEDGDYFQLSVFVNWRFINLNEAFRSSWAVDRLLYANSDVVSSGIVGNKMEDLLRVVPYISSEGRGTFHFEPEHIHYKTLWKAFFEVIETQVSEQDGQLVDFFESGECTVTLHFKRDFLAAT